MTRAARRAGLGLLAGACALGPVVVLAALPPFQIGIWYQAEPVIAALHAVSAVAALGLALALAGGVAAARRALGHPLVLVPLALALWSAAMTPLVALPGLSWLGTPEQGEGIAWYADLGVLCAAALVVRQWPAARRLAGGVALVALAAAGALALSAGLGDRWGLFRHDDYLGFYGVVAPAVLVAWIAPRGASARAALVAAGLAVVVVSGNRSALAAAAVAGLCVAGAELVWRRRPARLRAAVFAAALAVPLAVAPAVLIVGGGTPESSLWSRALHYQVARDSLAAAPAAWLTGVGWGGHGDRVVAHAPLAEVDLTGGGEGPRWDSMGRFLHFHSHHGLIEALLSAGLPALALAWLLPALPALLARRRLMLEAGLVAVGGAGLLALWPMEAGAVPYWALAIAGVSRPPRGAGPGRRWTVPLAGATALLGLALAASAALVAATARDAGEAIAGNRDTAGLAAAVDPACARAHRDFGRGGVHLAAAMRSYSVDLAHRLDDDAVTAADAARFADYACAARARLAEGASLRLAAAALLADAEIAAALRRNEARGAAADWLRGIVEDGWRARLESFLDRAPGRSDLAIPFLVIRLADGAEDQVAAVAAGQLARDADDPVALWFSGAVMAGDPATAAAGVARMRRALDAGIERRLPVDPEIARRLRAPAD